MARAYQRKPSALIVGQAVVQRDFVDLLLEDCGLTVIDCADAISALQAMSAIGEDVQLVFTAGPRDSVRDSVNLARVLERRWPHVHVVALPDTTSGQTMPVLPRGEDRADDMRRRERLH